MSEVVIDRVDILDRIRRSEAKDDEVVKAVKKMKRAGVKVLRDEGLMLKEGKIYVPKDKKLRAEVIRLHHDTPVEGHGGQWKITELVTRNFWWLGVSREVKQYVEGVINRPLEPKIVRLEGWKERELFSDGLDEGF